MNVLISTSSFSAEIPAKLNPIYNPFKRKLSENEVFQLIEQHRPVGMIAGVEPLTRKVLGKAEKLKVISRCGVGTDSVDMQAAIDFGIKVTITPKAPMVSVGELTIGMILSLIRRINLNDAMLRNGKWKGPAGNLLSGKTVGIVGCGRIGSYVAEILSAFGCKLYGFDPFVSSHHVCSMVLLDELIEKSDIITLHIPYSEENRHLINSKRLEQMKSNALLINASRGGLIDEDALYEALKAGRIAGAALDCFETEPYAGKLIELENTVLIPHMGSSARESRAAMEKEAVDNLVTELRILHLLED